jgi:polyribonucleotide nucleotidyltransferase
MDADYQKKFSLRIIVVPITPESIHIVIKSLKDVVKSFMNRLTVKINNDKTSIVAISITDPTVKKAEFSWTI